MPISRWLAMMVRLMVTCTPSSSERGSAWSRRYWRRKVFCTRSMRSSLGSDTTVRNMVSFSRNCRCCTRSPRTAGSSVQRHPTQGTWSPPDGIRRVPRLARGARRRHRARACAHSNTPITRRNSARWNMASSTSGSFNKTARWWPAPALLAWLVRIPRQYSYRCNGRAGRCGADQRTQSAEDAIERMQRLGCLQVFCLVKYIEKQLHVTLPRPDTHSHTAAQEGERGVRAILARGRRSWCAAAAAPAAGSSRQSARAPTSPRR